MPDIAAHNGFVGGAQFISVFDLEAAYHQIPIAEPGIEKTIFVTHKGKYIFQRMPFGIANEPWSFRRIMTLRFANFQQRSDLLV